MSEETPMETMTYEPMAGETIEQASRAACEMAREHRCRVEVSFNDLPVVALPDSDPAALATAYRAECERRHAEYLASPAYAEAMRLAEERQRERERALAAALAESPATITLRDPSAWQAAVDANPDPYGAAAIRYAEKWARIMEGRIARGSTVAECAKEASHVADDEGITGHMQGYAGRLLAGAWVHGEELSRWHDADVAARKAPPKPESTAAEERAAIVAALRRLADEMSGEGSVPLGDVELRGPDVAVVARTLAERFERGEPR